jgi:RNA-directed DNA polymerase
VVSPLLANIALNGIENIHKSVRYADDMVFVLKPGEDEAEILAMVAAFLADRGLNVSQRKTKVTATTDGFDFLGWRFKVQSNGKFRCVPAEDNYLKFRQKVKAIVNNSNYGARIKASKLAPIVRGWRQYHKYCKMSGTRFSLSPLRLRTYWVFNKEAKQTRQSCKTLLNRAFPAVSYSENRHIMVKGDRSPYDGDLIYWSERNSKLYEGTTAKTLKRQNHSCGYCGLKMTVEQGVHLHHRDGNHTNCQPKNLMAVHAACHDYIHAVMAKTLHTSKGEPSPN